MSCILTPTLGNYLSPNDKLGFRTSSSSRGTLSGCRHLTLCRGIISFIPMRLSVEAVRNFPAYAWNNLMTIELYFSTE